MVAVMNLLSSALLILGVMTIMKSARDLTDDRHTSNRSSGSTSGDVQERSFLL